MNLVESRFLNSGEANRVADIADSSDNGNIDIKELNSLLKKKNNILSKKIKIAAKNAYIQLQQEGKTNNVDKQDFINLLKGQENEHKEIKNNHEKAKKEVKNNVYKEETNFLSQIGDSLSDAGDSIVNIFTSKEDKKEHKKLTKINKKQTEVIEKNNKEVINLLAKTLKKGDKGNDVRKLQKFLKENNYLVGKVDGDYGRGTQKAVKKFLKGEEVKTNNSNSVKTNNSIIDRAISGIDRADSIISDFENDIIGTNDIISKNIGVYGALNGVFEKKPRTASEAYLKQMIGAKDCNRILNGIEKAIAKTVKSIADVTPDFIKNLKGDLIAMALKAASTYAISGGTGFALDLFGIKINEKVINVGKVENILKSEGFDYVSVRDVVVKGKNNPKKIETYAKKIAGKHFDKGTETRTTNEVMYRNVVDEKVFKAFAYIGNLLGIESDTSNMNDLLDKYNNSSNVKERAKFAQEINTLLYKIKSPLKSDINKKEIKLRKLGSDIVGKFTEEYSELENDIKDLKNRLKTIANPFQQNQNVADHTGDLSRKINGNKSQSEKAIVSKNFDAKNGLKPIHKLDVSRGKFGEALPTKLTPSAIKKWIKTMETGYVGNKNEGTAISKMITSIRESYNIGDISLKDFKKGIMDGHYLNAEGRAEFKKILSKNLSGTGGGNLNIADFDIFVANVGGRIIYLKQNCANVQDVTPDVLANVYKPQYFTVTAWIKTGHTDAIEKSETHKENHQKEETRTREIKETKHRNETYNHTEYTEEQRTETHTEYTEEQVKVPNTNPGTGGGEAVNNNGTSVNNGNAPAGGPNTTGPTTPGNNGTEYHTETIKVPHEVTTTTTVKVPHNVSTTVKVPYIVTRTEEYTVLVDNWVDVTTYWTEYIKHGTSVDLFGSIAASIVSTMTEKEYFNMICEKAIKAGIPEEIAKKGAKNLIKATSKVAKIPGEYNNSNKGDTYMDLF